MDLAASGGTFPFNIFYYLAKGRRLLYPPFFFLKMPLICLIIWQKPLNLTPISLIEVISVMTVYRQSVSEVGINVFRRLMLEAHRFLI